MNLENIKKRIGTYLNSDKRWPIIVDFSTRKDIADFVDFFNVGENTFLSAEQFCGEDGTFKVEEFINTVANNEGNTFVVGATAFLKLHGEVFTKNTLKSVLSTSVGGHIVIVTYQCKNYLKFADTRYTERNQIMITDGEPDAAPEICLISPALVGAFPGSFSGFEKLGAAFENTSEAVVYIATDVSKKTFAQSVFNIQQLNNSYDILCSKDSRTKTVPSSFGTAEQWNVALTKIAKGGDWTTIAETEFTGVANLADCVAHYTDYDKTKKWLYFILLSIFGVKQSPYLQKAVFASASYKEFQRSLFRTILTVEHTDPDFASLYQERKDILKDFTEALEDVDDYCKVLAVKEETAIYYLTDLTQLEKEKIIAWLSVYGEGYDNSTLAAMLRNVYPDLADYLSTFRFKNALLNTYFENYKYQKVINKILPSFELVVDEQSKELGFVDWLPARSAIVDKLNLSKAHAYFLDALGVEYLSFIQAKCSKYGLSANIVCGRCELPSLTCFNKEFLDTLKGKNCPVSDIKELDEIKHHGENNFSYENVKTPIYLIRELEIIDELLRKIRVGLYGHQYDKAVILSDHGASRLAVLHETESPLRMATDGVHSGRCCPKNEIDTKPDFAIEAENFWVLSNYDRFKGGRKANVEVHGGASLEEVTVPVIEITRKQSRIEAFITDESKIITLSAKEYPILKIYVGVESNNISILLDGKYYDANKAAQAFLYEIHLPEYTKKGIYTFDILNGSNTVATGQKFEVKKKGFSEVSLFD